MLLLQDFFWLKRHAALDFSCRKALGVVNYLRFRNRYVGL
jgi:hypothetical protein